MKNVTAVSACCSHPHTSQASINRLPVSSGSNNGCEEQLSLFADQAPCGEWRWKDAGTPAPEPNSISFKISARSKHSVSINSQSLLIHTLPPHPTCSYITHSSRFRPKNAPGPLVFRSKAEAWRLEQRSALAALADARRAEQQHQTQALEALARRDRPDGATRRRSRTMEGPVTAKPEGRTGGQDGKLEGTKTKTRCFCCFWVCVGGGWFLRPKSVMPHWVEAKKTHSWSLRQLLLDEMQGCVSTCFGNN